MEDRRDILAVQTLRNQVMAATFLASTAILISLGLLNAAIRPGIFNEISQALNLTGARNETLWMLKLMLLAVLFFSAFFNFTLSIRYYNNAGFMINISESTESFVSPVSVAEVLNQAALHCFLGMRGYYLSVPLVLWIFGPLWMFVGTAVLLGILYRLDREAEQQKSRKRSQVQRSPFWVTFVYRGLQTMPSCVQPLNFNILDYLYIYLVSPSACQSVD